VTGSKKRRHTHSTFLFINSKEVDILTKVELILQDERYEQFEKLRIQRLYEKQQYSMNVPLDEYMKHLTRKYCELWLEFYHGNLTALKKECADLANLAMFVYLHIAGFRE